MARRQLVEPKPAVTPNSHGLEIVQDRRRTRGLVGRLVAPDAECEPGRNVLAVGRDEPAVDAAQLGRRA